MSYKVPHTHNLMDYIPYNEFIKGILVQGAFNESITVKCRCNSYVGWSRETIDFDHSCGFAYCGTLREILREICIIQYSRL